MDTGVSESVCVDSAGHCMKVVDAVVANDCEAIALLAQKRPFGQWSEEERRSVLRAALAPWGGWEQEARTGTAQDERTVEVLCALGLFVAHGRKEFGHDRAVAAGLLHVFEKSPRVFFVLQQFNVLRGELLPSFFIGMAATNLLGSAQATQLYLSQRPHFQAQWNNPSSYGLWCDILVRADKALLKLVVEDMPTLKHWCLKLPRRESVDVDVLRVLADKGFDHHSCVEHIFNESDTSTPSTLCPLPLTSHEVSRRIVEAVKYCQELAARHVKVQGDQFWHAMAEYDADIHAQKQQERLHKALGQTSMSVSKRKL